MDYQLRNQTVIIGWDQIARIKAGLNTLSPRHEMLLFCRGSVKSFWMFGINPAFNGMASEGHVFLSKDSGRPAAVQFVLVQDPRR